MPSKTLAEMLDDLRAEAGLSLSPAHHQSNRDAQVHLLRRVQEQLYNQHDWPSLLVDRDITTQPGERFYEYPEDLDYERITDVFVKYGSVWYRMGYGIGPDEYNRYGGDEDFQTTPPQQWMHVPDDTRQFRIWPVPSDTVVLRLRGQRRLGQLVEDDDKSTLDGTLITLFAASELLARAKAEDATLKLQAAQAHLRVLKGQQGGNKGNVFVMGGHPPRKQLRVGIDYIPRGFGN